MPVIESINQKYPRAYAFPQDVKNLLCYIAKPDATAYPPFSCQHLIGAMPDIVSADQPGAWKRAARLFFHQLELYPKQGCLMQHRVISFSSEESQDPVRAVCLAKEVAAFYYERGYLSFFGVHMDTDNLHIHIAVSNISWKDGSYFFICSELALLYSGINEWYQNYMCEKIRGLFCSTSLE